MSEIADAVDRIFAACPGDWDDILVELDQGREAVNRGYGDLAADMRRDGVTWKLVGYLFGISAQAAQQRYGKKDSNG